MRGPLPLLAALGILLGMPLAFLAFAVLCIVLGGFGVPSGIAAAVALLTVAGAGVALAVHVVRA